MTWQEASIKLNDRDVYAVLDAHFSDMAPIIELPCLNWLGLWPPKPVSSEANDSKKDDSWFLEVEPHILEIASTISDGWAVYVARLVTRGVTEYYFYTKDESTLASLVPELRKHFPQHRMEHERKSDQTWSEYFKFQAAMS